MGGGICNELHEEIRKTSCAMVRSIHVQDLEQQPMEIDIKSFVCDLILSPNKINTREAYDHYQC